MHATRLKALAALVAAAAAMAAAAGAAPADTLSVVPAAGPDGAAKAAAAAAAGTPNVKKRPAPGAPAAPAEPVPPARIRAALEKGGAYLARVVADDKTTPDFAYPLGARALYAAALLSAGRPPEDPLVVRLFRTIESLPMTHVYSAALVAIALDVRHKEIVRGQDPERAPKRMTGQAHALLARAVNWILAAQVQKTGGWSYEKRPSAKTYDLSNTQFAVLALAIGQRHGLAVPPQAVERFAKACLALQSPETSAHQTEIAYQVDLAAPEKSRPRRTLSGTPAGWVYAPDSRLPYFAMTAATVGNLFAAGKMLRSGGAPLDAAIDQGLLWLDRRWDTFTAQHLHRWRSLTRNYYYTLWSVEKAFDLGEIARIGERDWYQEEAAFLVDSQKEDGSWGDEPLTPVATSFALLFLARSTAAAPLLTSAPALYTGPGSAADHDRVLVRKLGGYVSAKALLASLAESADPRLIPLAREVVESYAVDHRENLIGPLGELLACRSAAIARFASGKLAALTGVANPNVRSIDAWRTSFEKIRCAQAARDIETLRVLAGEDLNATLFEHLARAIESARARELVPDLVRAFAASPPDRRKRLHGVLCFLTGERIPFDSSAAKAWENYLRGKGEAR